MSGCVQLSNREIADQLDEIADVLRHDGTDKWRVRAYREAARTVRELDEDVVAILERRGRPGLIELPSIGRGIAARIEDMVYGPASGEQLLMFAEEPEPAPPPKRPRRPKPERVVRDLFEDIVGPDEAEDAPPPVELLLALDARFREHVQRGERADRTSGEWLPTWQVEKAGLTFTVRFSNSATAQRLGRSHDWVVLEWRDGDDRQNQATVVTEYRGPLSGRRVVRGRERECLSHWARATEQRLKEQYWDRTA